MNIVLVGNSGSGKSSVGIQLAKALHRPFVDTDEAIERYLNKHPSSILREDGINFFREKETEVLKLSLKENWIVSTGAGIVEIIDNLDLLEHHFIIWLDCPSNILWARIKDDKYRPLSRTQEDVERLVELRSPIYQRIADMKIEVQNKTIEEVVAEIVVSLPT